MRAGTVANPRRTRGISVAGPDGQRVTLRDLPLVAYALNCGHLGRDHGISKRDLVFCGTCEDTKRVARVLAE